MEDNANKWKKIDAWIQRVAWLFGIVTSVAIAIFTWQQNGINEKLNQEKHLLQQPVFQVQKIITKSEGSDTYDYEDIEIYNHGEMAKDIESVHLDTYLYFIYTPNILKQKCDTFYVPVSYYGIKYTTYNLTGLIAYTQTTQLNLQNFARIYREVLYTSKYPLIAEVDKMTLVTINYVDKYDKHHTVAFINGKNVNESQVALIQKRSMSLNQYKIWELDELSYEKLVEICQYEK